MENIIPIFMANKFGTETGVHIKGGGDNYDSGFFRGLRLKLDPSEVNQPYRQHIWTYACVNAQATTISSVPFIIVKESPDAPKAFRIKRELQKLRAMPSEDRTKLSLDELKFRGFEVIEDGPIYNTFRDVNSMMTRSQLWEATSIWLLLEGACFWLLEDGNEKPITQGAWPKEIYPCSPTQFEPIIKDGRLVKWVRKFGSETREYELYQVLWFRFYNPYNDVKGMAPYEPVKEAAQQDYKYMKYNEAFLDNGGDPGGYIKLPKVVDDKSRRQILTTWEDRHKGVDNTGKTALLTGGSEYVQLTTNHKDMEFIEGRKWNRDETFAGFRTPKKEAGIYDDLNYATAKIEDKSYWEKTIIPRLRYFEDLLESKLFSKTKEAQNYYPMFDLSGVEALSEDLEGKIKTADTMIRMGVPLNDVVKRLHLGFNEYAWGNSWWAPFNLTPIDSDGTGSTDADATATETNGSKTPIELKMDSVLFKIQKKIDKEKHWNLYIATIFTPIERPFSEKLKSFWFKLRSVQLKKLDEFTKGLTRATPSYEELNKILFDNDEWQARISEMASPFYADTGERSVAQVALELGTPIWNISDPRIVAILSSKENKIKTVIGRFWEQLRVELVEGITANETSLEIAERFKTQFNAISTPGHNLTIARTEIAQCASTVRNVNFKGEGVTKHEWSDSRDEHVRDDHKAFGSFKAVNLEYNYLDVVSKGGQGTLFHPSDMNAPADQVINCRCVELPVS